MSKKSYLNMMKIFSTIGFLLVITVNSLANIIPINGRTTGQISDNYPNLFAPAGLTFSIWLVIYIFLFLYTLYQTGIFSKHSLEEIKTIKEIGGLYILSCIANAAWIFAWHYERIFISVIIMLVLLLTLINIYLKTRLKADKPFSRKLFVSLPFSLYLGWVTVATIANITILLVAIDWTGWGIAPQIWTTWLILIALVITVAFQRKFKDIAFSAVVFWAFLGIFIRHMNTFNAQYPLVLGTTILGMTVILAVALMSLMKKRGNY